MCQAMLHRGPDDQNVGTIGPATIGTSRLAIFDPANGRQPMSTPDGRWTLVFNGAIYNHRQLRAELSARGWSFRTDCDTEVLLAAFAQWGIHGLDRLRGMYAFAIWDNVERTLCLARDPFGIKPLYLRERAGELVFASELNALIASGAITAELDPIAVADYLAWFSVPAPRTIYRDVISLRPGEYAIYREGKLDIRSGWSFSGIPETSACQSHEEFVEQLRGKLEDSIRAHMLADVPVGAFLSGGLDSAAVVGLMSRASGSALRTFCIGFDEAGYSEATQAQATAHHFGAIHHTEMLTGERVAADLDRILGALDQPTGDGINTYYASQAARAGGVTVALSGLGGDELFGGYPSFRGTPRIARFLPVWRRAPRSMRNAIVRGLRGGDTRRRKLADILQHAANINDVGALQRRVFSQDRQYSLLHPDTLSAIAPVEAFHPEVRPLEHELRAAGAFEIVSAWELRTYMADVLLRDSDVMSMRHSLELRVPFVDRPLIEWLWRQPRKAAIGSPKAALYQAVADLLPPEMAQRRKRGFTLPFPVWMKGELRPFLDETFSNASVDRTRLFARPAVQDLWRGFLVGKDTREWSRIWSLAVLISFSNRRGVDVPSRVTTPQLRASKRLGRGTALLMAPEIFASEGGIPRILQLYLRALCTDPDIEQVRLVALNDGPAHAIQANRFGGRVESAAACSRHKPQFVREALRAARHCDTIVCGHIGQLPVAWLAQKLNRSLRYYLVAHGIEVWRKFTPLERTALRGAERIFCVSDYTRRELLRHCSLLPSRVSVLPNALDPVFPIEGGKPLANCAPTILVVTRVTYADRYKGVQHVIEAMPAIRTAIPDARLRIVGRGDDVPRLQQLCANLGITDTVQFTGYIDDASLLEELRTCRLFALPSRKEGFGLVFLEAMAQGRPCLGAAAGGIPEVITPETGVLVGYGDVEAIARASIDALTRRWDEQRILARAREFSFDLFRQRLARELSI
jgi:asparagine synthase (glutamine-hydrolysing)